MSIKNGCTNLSFSQERFWNINQLEFKKSTCNIPIAYRVFGLLDSSLLEKSLSKIRERHEILRTSFVLVDEQLVQTTLPKTNFALQILSFEELHREQQEAEIRQQAIEEFQKPFDIGQQPLWRAKLLRLSKGEYILLLTFHHIIFDSESFNILFKEIEFFYNDEFALLPDFPIQYTDFAQHQHQTLDKSLQDQLPYWEDKLNENLPILQSITDRQRTSVDKGQIGNRFFKLPMSLAEGLNALSEKKNVTLSTVFLTAFRILLYRYSRQKNIIIGSSIEDRFRCRTEGLIGLFTRLLPLRIYLEENYSFQQLLTQVHHIASKDHLSQDLPFDKLVEALRIEEEKILSLFQAMFCFRKSHIVIHNFSNLVFDPIDDLTLQPIGFKSLTANFDLGLELQETSEGVCGWFEYNTDLFDENTISRMTGHFLTLLESIVINPEKCISKLPILTNLERNQVLVEWNNTKVDYPLNKCTHQLFEEQVRRTPDEISVIFEDQQLTYQQLNSRANQLACYLQQRGVKPETLVGICTERSLEMIVGLLGILKAGGAYVPLDPDYPPERLTYMMKDSQVSILLTQQNLSNRISVHQAQIIYLDKDWQKIAQFSKENCVSEVESDNLAYVIYTSGSTGKPKGAMNTHKGLCNRLLWMQDTYKLDSIDRVLQKTPFSFDVSVWELFLPLLTGSCLVIAKPQGHKDSAYLVNLITQQEITTLHFVPSMLQVFLEEEGLEHCSSLKRVICSGEALPWKLQERFFDRLQCELNNLYGPTEAAIDVTYWKCQKESQLKTVPIGRPIANTKIYILNSCLQTVPIGVPGELHIGGVQVARGYLNRPELTEQKFIPSPFQRLDRLYKTGDLAKYLPDGTIEYLGRIDHQVKIRGFRIELGEIENVINQYSVVRESVVITLEKTLEHTVLIAYIVARKMTNGQHQPTIVLSELRQFIKEKLPDYMIPAAFVILDALPLTPNGKVNRLELPKPDLSISQMQLDFVAPRNLIEQHIANIWVQILELKRVGIHDNFFDLGGYSLLGIRVIDSLRKTFKVELPLQILIEAPTIAELGYQVQKKLSKNTKVSN